MNAPTTVALATDSPDPSGVGQHMLILAATLDPEWQVCLMFPDDVEGHSFVARAALLSLTARTVADDRWGDALAGFSLVHVHAGIGWEGRAIVRAARTAGARVVRTEHLPWLLTDAVQCEDYARMIAEVDAVITVSQASANSWRRVLAGLPGPRLPLACISNGIAARDSGPAAVVTRQAGLILCVARLTAQKNHRLLLTAMNYLVQSHPDAVLVLAGDGPERETLERLAQPLGESVRFLGHRDDVPALMARAAVLVLASDFEGLPLVVLEAMAAGLPVVATRIGGVVEALSPDHPWLVPQGDADALAHTLATALEDPAARNAVAAAQQNRFKTLFTAERMTAQTSRIYTAALRGANKDLTMNKTRLGFIGAGGIANRHFGVLAQMDDVEVVAVADPDESRATEAAARTGATAFADAETMLAQASLDAVYICVPPFAHGPAERACLARDLPFFVEKPLSLDLALAEDIAAEIESAGLITATGYHWRYLDTVDDARAQLMENAAHLR